MPWRGESHGPGAGVLRLRTPTLSYTDRAMGLLIPVARNRIKFIEIAIRFRQSRPDIPRPETPPSFLNDGYLAENL
jgi:hypothetical protein